MPGYDERQYIGSSTAFDPTERHIRRTPSPSYYERPFIPSPRNPPYRDEYQPNSRSEVWRQERAYYGGTPSPDRLAYTRTTDETQWGRPSWRSPTAPAWQDRRFAQNMNDSTWAKPTRRDLAVSPILEPSDNWKQIHGLPSDSRERRWSYEPRAADPVGRESERSPERGPPRDHYTPPGYPIVDRYRKPSQGPDLRESHPYATRSESHRPQYNDSNGWSPPAYYPADASTSASDSRIRESQRSPYWETRVPLRNTSHDKHQYRHYRAASIDSPHDDAAPSTYRSRSMLQDRQPEYVGPNIKWNSRIGSPTVAPRTPRSRMSSNSYTSPQRIQSRSRSSSGSSRGNVLPHTRTLPSEGEYDRGRFKSPQQQAHQYIVDRGHETSSYVTPVKPKVDAVATAQPSESQPEESSAVVVHRNDRSDAASVTMSSTAAVVEPRIYHEDCPAVSGSPCLPESASADAIEPLVDRQPDTDRSPLFVPGAEEPLELDVPLALSSASARDITPFSVTVTPAEQHVTRFVEETLLRTSEEETAALPEPMPLYEALRVLVMLRLQRDTQTREERVDPILMDNLTKVEPVMSTTDTPDTVVQEITRGVKLRARQRAFKTTQPSLQIRFAQRQAELSEKVQTLRAEYLALHKQWLVHCTKLDDVAKNLALQEAAATAGRTTRRSLATMGDAVRSDLEMEQIIASLGTEEMTDANHLGARNAAVIPDMVTVEVGEVEYAFDDTNKEIDNPAEYYTPRTGIHDWTEEEVAIFVEKFAEFPKQFGTIADCLPHKTPAQCVAFYYLHKHRHIDFRQVVARRVVKRKRGNRKQKSNALLADIQQKDDEVTAPTRRRRTALLPFTEPRRAPSCRTIVQSELTPTGTPTPEPDGESRKRRRRITARTTAADEEDGNEEEENDSKPAKRAKRTRKPRQQSITPLPTPTIMEDIPLFARILPGDIMETSNTIWSDSDKALFRHLLLKYGTDFELISASMPTKTSSQIAYYYKVHAAELNSDPSARLDFVQSIHRSGPIGHNTFAHGSTYFEDGGPFEPHSFNRSYSRETSGGSTPVATKTTTLPTSLHARQSPLEVQSVSHAYAHPLPPRVHESEVSPSRAHHPLVDSMSHLGISSIATSREPITNPSPFTIASTLPMFSFGNHSSSPFATGPRPLGDTNSAHHSKSPPVDARTKDPAAPNASTAFDTAPAFAPAPQVWTRAPLQTTDDLVAYLEHRTRLAQQ